MADSSVSKPLGLVFIITAQMIFNGRGHEQVTGFLGGSVTLQFTFNVSITNTSSFGIYVEKEKKISDNSNCRSCFDIHPKNSSVFYHITNLTGNDSETYWASLLLTNQVIKSNKVQLILGEETKNTTVSQTQINSTVPADGGSSSLIVVVLVVFPAALLTAALPLVICCFDKSKDRKPREQQTSNPTLQETVEVSSSPAPSVVYSVLNFPTRPPAALEPSPSDTDYAVVSCLPGKREN